MPEKTLKVKSALSGRDAQKVAFWERDPNHPGGEAFVGPKKAVVVGDTTAVRVAIRGGRLQEVGGHEEPTPETETSSARGRRQ